MSSILVSEPSEQVFLCIWTKIRKKVKNLMWFKLNEIYINAKNFPLARTIVAPPFTPFDIAPLGFNLNSRSSGGPARALAQPHFSKQKEVLLIPLNSAFKTLKKTCFRQFIEGLIFKNFRPSAPTIVAPP